MTGVTRRIRRIVPGSRRPFVLLIEPATAESGPLVRVYEKGRRVGSGYAIEVPALYTLLALRAADNRRAKRRGRKRGL